jgi:DNA polymerase-1
MAEKKLFLLDGHALVYRAHFAFINRPLINSKGVNTSAITGFVRTLWDLIKNQKPTHIAVAFDPKGGTFRNEYYPEYKANREAQPEDISIAIPHIIDILEGFKIPILCVDNYEADDVIGTLAKQAEKEGFTVYMVTPDKDYGQLVSENIFMYKPSRQGNGVEILGENEIKEIWGISRIDQVIDSLGLIGDKVDNIPGVPGIGPKTAEKLLAEFGSLEEILENADKVKGKNGERLQEFADQARLSKELATINIQSPIQFDANQYQIDPMDKEMLTMKFQELEFRTLATQILGEDQPGTQGTLFASSSDAANTPPARRPVSPPEYSVVEHDISNTAHEYITLHTKEERAKLIADLAKQKIIAFDTETTSVDAHNAELVGMVFSYEKGKAYYIPTPEDQAVTQDIVNEFKALLESDDKLWIGQNIKYDAIIMKWYGVDLDGPFFDTMIAHYLCEPDLRHKLDYLSEAYLEYKMVPIEDLIGKGKKQLSMRDVDPEKVQEYAGEDADVTLQLYPKMQEMLKELDVTEVYDNIEIPLINVLRDMEFEGVKLNGDFLKSYSKDLAKLIAEKEKEIYTSAGVEFNIASPSQVGRVLFEKLEIPYRWRKNKSGTYSTDVEKLNELAPNYPIVDAILEYRKYTKLKSTYVDSLPLQINPKSGRIHSNFNQVRAATGRLASDNPNLQNIPIKNEAGREIRKAFEPRNEDYILLAADYSQIELRLIAEISGDEAMLEAFVKGNDFHRATAAKVFDVPYEEVTDDQRRTAKTVNFSITYGAGATNLSRQLGISRNEATTLITNYFTQFKGLKRYMDDTVAFAREQGYVQTLMCRKRILRDINSKNGLIRSNAERIAINTPIQGTAADLIKIAMINIHKEIRKRELKTRLILQVHDELVFDVFKSELDEVKTMVADLMTNAMPDLKVPILVEMDTGKNWLEAH